MRIRWRAYTGHRTIQDRPPERSVQIRATSSLLSPGHSTTQTRTGSGRAGFSAPATWCAIDSWPVMSRCSTASRPLDSARSTRRRLRSTVSAAQHMESGRAASDRSTASRSGSGRRAITARTGAALPGGPSRANINAVCPPRSRSRARSRARERAPSAVSSRTPSAAVAADPALAASGSRATPYSTVPSPPSSPAQPSARPDSQRSSSREPPARASPCIRMTSSARLRACTPPPLLPCSCPASALLPRVLFPPGPVLFRRVLPCQKPDAEYRSGCAN